MIPDTITRRDLSQKLQVHPITLARWEPHRLRPIRIGRAVRYDLAEVQQLITELRFAKRKKPGPKPRPQPDQSPT